MGTNRFILGKTYLALISCVPTVVLLVCFTDEIIHFLNRLVEAVPILSTNAQIPLLVTFILSFLFTFLLHKHFLRKKSYSILATSHIPIQLIVVIICIFLITPLRPETMKMENWSGYLLFGFLLSVVVSDISYSVDYYKRCPIHLTSIENVLSRKPRTEEEKKPRALRHGGFLWVDFSNRIVVERNETEELSKRLTNENSVMLIGHQASGKSVILRNLGYKLALSGHIVLFANADSLNLDLALEDITNWNMSNVVILIDDVHRNPIGCSDFLEKTRAHNVKIVLSSRPMNMNVFREGESSQLAKLFEKKVEAKVSERMISDMIINCYSPNLRFEPKRKDVTAIIGKCGTDLWLITYFLASWNPQKANIEEVSKADMYEKIYEIRVSKWGIAGKNSINVMQVICALYQYEIPCVESYLIEIGLNDEAFKLVAEGHLIRKGRYYYLHHPSVARIYLETLKFCKLIEDLDSLSIEILSSYLEKSKEERAHVFYKLSTFPKEPEEKTAILRSMLETIKFEELVHQIEQERDIDKIDYFFRSISNINRNSAETLLKIVGEESLTKKLLTEPIVKKQKNLISDIAILDRDLGKRLSKKRLVVGAIIPLYNEENAVSYVFRNLLDYVDFVIVVDDHSSDGTNKKALRKGVEVIRHRAHKGFLPSIITGLERALEQNVDVVVLDAFPWINPHHIPKLIGSILNKDADLVVGLHRGVSYGVQAMNRKGIEKFLKHMPNVFPRGESNLGLSSVLFSKILRVTEIDIEILPIPYVRILRSMSLDRFVMSMRDPHSRLLYRHYMELETRKGTN